MKKWIAFLLILTCVSSLAFASNNYDDQINDLEGKKDDLHDELNDIRDQQQGVKEDISQNLNEIRSLDRKIQARQGEIDELETRIRGLMTQIEYKKTDLSESEYEYARYMELFNKRLRAMYMNSDMDYMELMLTAQSISELAVRLDMVSYIAENDQRLLEDLNNTKILIRHQKYELELSEQEMRTKMQTVVDAKSELLVASTEKKSIYDTLQDQYAELKKAVAEMEAQEKAVGDEIKRLQMERDYVGGELAWPSPGYYYVTSKFGQRFHPVLKRWKLHTGIDLRVPSGSKIVAANAGVVLIAKYNVAYGNYVVIDHGGGISTLYAHNKKLLVSAGQTVKRGQVISYSGSTGYSTGPHLHFEYRINGEYQNPLDYLKK
ncbi:M23 family metallopeptidase [Gottschalkiaceae bacterium SANA]|nr:M23 family metallopeptidase [Gottschalkiaceae bacterium SANA]